MRFRPRPVAYTNLDVLASVAGGPRSRKRWIAPALLVLALALAAGALANPAIPLSEPMDDATVVLLVDVSGSMQARDVEPSRLDAATAAMRTFLDRLPPQVDVGLVQFSTAPTVLAPPATDRERVRAGLAYLRQQFGTAIGDGIAVATQLIRTSLADDGYVRSPVKPLPAEIVLLSDGNQTQGKLKPTPAALAAARAGIRIDTVALGTPRGTVKLASFGPGMPVPPDPTLMQAIARDTGGTTYTAHDAGRLEDIYDHLGASIGRHRVPHAVGSWLAGAAALLLLAAVGFGVARHSPL